MDISKDHISATAHSIHLYSAHRAVIFAIAQLSCYNSCDISGLGLTIFFWPHPRPRPRPDSSLASLTSLLQLQASPLRRMTMREISLLSYAVVANKIYIQRPYLPVITYDSHTTCYTSKLDWFIFVVGVIFRDIFVDLSHIVCRRKCDFGTGQPWASFYRNVS